MIVKNEEEKEILRKGGVRLAAILEALKQMVTPGISTHLLEDRARALIKEAGGTPAFLGYTPQGSDRPYPSALCVSINEEIVHGIPNEHPVEIMNGDVVTLDCGLVYEGYITDAAVSLVAGKGSKKDHDLVSAVHEALEAGIGVARAGATTGDIGYAIDQIGNKYNVRAPLELGGHGVGKSVHEEPFVPNWGKKGEGAMLSDGMVIAIEPMFSLGTDEIMLADDGYTYMTKDGSKAAHAEHTVLITKEGAEVLTASRH